MKKPTVSSGRVPHLITKLISKYQKENDPFAHRTAALDPLELVKAAAQNQQMRVVQLIQEINQ